MTQATANPAPGFVRHPEHRVDLAREGRRVVVRFGGVAVADTTAAITVRESRYPEVYYVPLADVGAEFLARTGHRTYCPFKGEASYWTLSAGGKTAENAVWGYETPYDEVAALAGHVAFYRDRMDAVDVG